MDQADERQQAKLAEARRIADERDHPKARYWRWILTENGPAITTVGSK